jgi:hypothetical protein
LAFYLPFDHKILKEQPIKNQRTIKKDKGGREVTILAFAKDNISVT